MNLYVSNLHYDTSDLDLRREFARFATVTRCHIVRDRDTGRSKGYAFVEVLTHAEGLTCIYELSGADLDGRALSVQIAQDRPANDRPAARSRRRA